MKFREALGFFGKIKQLGKPDLEGITIPRFKPKAYRIASVRSTNCQFLVIIEQLKNVLPPK
jgi:hypothetical protein